jgi:two-component system C4-dicarboxylate transport sensor histidine kinase DctB
VDAGQKVLGEAAAVHSRSPDSSRRMAYTRFARAVFGIYVGTAVLGGTLLVLAVATDQANEQAIARHTLALTAEVRSEYFSRHLSLLASELRRLGLRSELNLIDQNMEPEQSLLHLSHSKSTFFNVGVAILNTDGTAMWSEPQSFLEPGTSLGHEPWFENVRTHRTVRIVPVAPEREHDSLVFVVSPVVRNAQFAGALVGAVDLAYGDAGMFAPATSSQSTRTVIATQDGRAVYPPKPPAYSSDPSWMKLFMDTHDGPFETEVNLDRRSMIIAGAPVQGTDLIFLSLIPADVLFANARGRLNWRLGLGFAVMLIPNLLLLFALRRSLREFRIAEEMALRDERFRFLGEAANLIAHEVKNALNGIRLGLDMALPPERLAEGGKEQSGGRVESGGGKARASQALRREVERLSEFTSELLTFSKGVVPRPVSINASDLVERVAELATGRAKDLGATLEIQREIPEIRVKADPSLVHVVISNLVTNALEAVATAEVSSPRVVVSVRQSPEFAEVKVVDNGAGVLEDMKPRLFEPFSTSKPSGVGIGLALSRRIARAHGGDLTLTPDSPGATFLFTLPLEKKR